MIKIVEFTLWNKHFCNILYTKLTVELCLAFDMSQNISQMLSRRRSLIFSLLVGAALTRQYIPQVCVSYKNN